MGLPGAGKTYLAERLAPLIDAVWLNADKVRKEADDWDFSPEGRLRQAQRMKQLSQKALDSGRHVIADFVCPTEQARKLYNPNFLIWVDTIKSGRFEDTNKIFVPPKKFDFKVSTQNAENWSKEIAKIINPNLNI